MPAVKSTPTASIAPRQLNRGQRLLLWPLVGLMKLWNATLRLKVNEADIAQIKTCEGPFVCLMWHNRLFTIGKAYQQAVPGRKLACLVSASKDGAWLSAFLEMMGLHPVRGSSSKRSYTATRELLATLEDGIDIGITPDGPRGPCYDFKEGAVMLARQAKAPLLFFTVDYSSKNAWRLKSWDRFWIPKPFARLPCRMVLIPQAEVDQLPKDRTLAARALAERLLSYTTDG